ncbi:MAG: hypothetical protein DMF63_08315 [Acidobacteria bacterium]|nr:MAG: hypothetical protein DMF63_08315 [Acidobacteriota bacterium]
MNVNGTHFEIGTIQAFLDGETTPEVSLRLTDHIAGCDECARLMADADEENAIVFSTLERELNSLVPTQRLWSRINETIEVEKASTPAWQKALAFVRASLLSPSLAAAAGILLILGIFAVWNFRTAPDVATGPTSPILESNSQINASDNGTTALAQSGSSATLNKHPRKRVNARSNPRLPTIEFR